MRKFVILNFFPAPFSRLSASWSAAWQSISFRRQTTFIIIVVLAMVVLISDYLLFIESRAGRGLNDRLLKLLPVFDLSLYIFILLYTVVLIAIINLCASPKLLLKGIKAYCLMVLFRMLCLYLVPLEAEASMIPLEDPFVGRFFYGDTLITKDLFFSGHVSTMSLIALLIPYRPLKYYLIIATILVAILILIQHVHYTIDVIAAPCFSWICYKIFSRKGSMLDQET